MMAARFQVHEHYRLGWIIPTPPAILQGVDFRMGLAKAFVIALSDDGSIAYNDGTDERIGRYPSGAALG